MFTSFKNNCKNPNFKLGTSEQNKVIASYGKLIGNASADVETVLYAGEIFKQYNDNLATFIEDRTKGDAIYELMKELTLIFRRICTRLEKSQKIRCGFEILITLLMK